MWQLYCDTVADERQRCKYTTTVSKKEAEKVSLSILNSTASSFLGPLIEEERLHFCNTENLNECIIEDEITLYVKKKYICLFRLVDK